MKTHYKKFTWALALVLTPWGTQARELPQVDALANAPLAVRSKASTSVPAGVDRWSREERLGVPSFVWMKPVTGATTKTAAVQDAPTAARAVLQQLAPAYGLSAQEVAAVPAQHRQTLAGGAQLVRFSNRKDGVEVFREQATVLLNAQSQAVSVGGYLGSTAAAPVSKAAGQVALTATDAIAKALADFGFDAQVAQQLTTKAQPSGTDWGAYTWYELPAGVEGSDGAVLEYARSKPVWFRLPQGLVRAHYVELRGREAGEEFGYAYVLGAGDGQLLLRNNQTAHANDFSYRVWADPVTKVPLPGPQGRNGTPHPTGVPDGYAPPLTAASLVTLANAPFTKNDPWLAAGATVTDGNNVRAYADLVASDGYNSNSAECTMDAAVSGDQRACVAGNGTEFDYVYDPGLGAVETKTQVAASVVSLFYTTNWLHDWFYDAGFDESAGNAQADNYGRGGAGGDAMRAEALDYSGLNNANMSTPADGAAPKMQMYRFVNQAIDVEVLQPLTLMGPEVSGGASFGPTAFDVTAEVANVSSKACSTLAAASLAGKIALIDRGTCEYATKAVNAQAAGAVGVVIVNNTAGVSTMGTGSQSGSVTIPAVMVSQDAGTRWRAALLGSPTLQLHLYATRVERSSALDGTVVAHEWGHYISNRLIGDSNGLTTNHAQGLGEGWGDFHALLMTVTEADKAVPGNEQYQGTYAIAAHSVGAINGPDADVANVAYFGMRRYPYSTDRAKNPLTFKHIQDDISLPSDVPVNANTASNAEVHNTGEVWASMLWQCYASLLNRHKFDVAQSRMKNYLVAGYKLTPINPTLTEARDALLAAMAVSDAQDYDSCAQGFALRGAGVGAQSPDRSSATNLGVVEDFGQHGVLLLDGMTLSLSGTGAQRCDADDVLDAGETAVLQLTVHNRGGTAVEDGRLQLAASVPGVEFVDGATQSLPSVAAWSTQVITVKVKATAVTTPQWVKLTATITYAGQVAAVTQDLVAALHQDQHAAGLARDSADAPLTAMHFGSTRASAQAAWAVVWDAQLNPLYQGLPPAAVGSTWMETPDLQVSNTQPFELTFTHRYRFESDGTTYYDGGQLMVSDDGGATWSVIPAAQAQYNGTLYIGIGDKDSGNPQKGQMAYVGQSASWPNLQTETVNLGTTYAGKTLRIRWVMQTDMAATDEGWQVDDITFTGIDNTPFPEVVADAQLCAALQAEGGAGQSATVGTAFVQPLRVKLQTAAGTALVGADVVFTAPASGASAVFAGGRAQATVVTDADGVAQSPALTANATAGSYNVVATRDAQTLAFALTNTADNSGGGGGSPAVLSFSGPSPLGQGTVTAVLQSAQQSLPSSARFARGAIVAAETVPALDGYRFPFGLADFVLQDVGEGNTVTMRMQYPTAVPAGAEYWKWGRTTADGSPHWYQIPMTVVNANTVEITLTDGDVGDSDAQADGTITDPGGVAIPVAASVMPVPALSTTALALLALLLAGLGLARRRVWKL